MTELVRRTKDILHVDRRKLGRRLCVLLGMSSVISLDGSFAEQVRAGQTENYADGIALSATVVEENLDWAAAAELPQEAANQYGVAEHERKVELDSFIAGVALSGIAVVGTIKLK